MFNIRVEGVDDLLAGLKGMERQIPYATANGLNSTARLVRDRLIAEMKSVFDSPTPFTLNSLQMTPAKAPRGPMVATVWFKDPPHLGTRQHYLLPQIEGGQRPRKRFETAMTKDRKFVIPGKDLTKGKGLDQYGNLGRGMITKLMSAEGSFTEAGFKMNRTIRNAGTLVVIRKQRGKLLPGIYERVAGDETGGRVGRYLLARGTKGVNKRELNARYKKMYPRGLHPLVIFTPKTPTYSKRLDFHGVALKVVDQVYRREMVAAIETEIQREFAYRAKHGR